MNPRSKHCQLAVSIFGDLAVAHGVYGTPPDLVEVPDHDGRSMFSATSGPVLRALLNAEAVGSLQAAPFGGPQQPQLDVRNQLTDGRVAFIAQTIDATQHQAVMRKLLATSDTTVTAYQGPFISD